VVATGVRPRDVKIPNKISGKVKVLSYLDVLKNNAVVGERVAVIGAGGIGYDVSEFLTHVSHGDASHHNSGGFLAPEVDKELVNSYLSEWGIIDPAVERGGLATKPPRVETARKIYLLQRKSGKFGSSLGKTTGWVHRAQVKKRQVEDIGGCKYVEVNDSGLVIEVGGKQRTLEVDTVVICAGQEALKTLYDPLKASVKNVFLIGGAYEALELDAKRAIDMGTRLAAVIETAKTGETFEAPDTTDKLVSFIKKML